MATYYSNKRGGWQLKADITYTQNIGGNYSDITIKVYLVADPTWRINASTMSGSTTINGSSAGFSANPSTGGGTTQLLTSRTVKVNHNSDGSKSVGISFSYALNIYSGSLGGNVGTLSGSGTLALPKIPRAFDFIISTRTVEMGTNLTVNVRNNGSGYQGWLYLKFGNKKVKLAGPTPIGSNFTVNPKIEDFASVIPNATSGTGSVVLETWQGDNNKIGENVEPVTLTIPDSVKPSISELIDTETESKVTDIIDVADTFVQYQSKIKLSATGTGIYGSTIRSYKFELDTANFNGSANNATFDLKTLELQTGTVPIKATVTDSRGRTASITKNINILTYKQPTALLKAWRSDDEQNPLDEGTFVTLQTIVSASPLFEKNPMAFTLERAKQGTDNWTEISQNFEGYEFDEENTYSGFTLDEGYIFRFTVKDQFTEVRSQSFVSTAFTTVDYRAGGHGIAFGKVATDDGFWVGGQMPAHIQMSEERHILTINKEDGEPSKIITMDADERVLVNNQLRFFDTGWIELNSDKTLIYRVKDNVLYIYIDMNSSTAMPSEGYVFGTLPEEYRPERRMMMDIAQWHMSTTSIGRFQINGKGAPDHGKCQLIKVSNDTVELSGYVTPILLG
ncbi:DUF859 family phage minor structural protein [Enterococcus nangangensis]|uniref:DUF859 family phage minor structural protein n=1 Tax=Enterococcus nangangensis TaxID=2559926 RepID=UPI0014857A8B|nr:DUF859 family phage minor structural protein [Enterococcus nangangensis]